MLDENPSKVRLRVVGVGGAGCNALVRMARHKKAGPEYLAINTDVQALGRIKGLPTFAIGPRATSGLGSGGNPDVGRKAVRESQQQLAQLLSGFDMIFVTAGMGGGTGTGAAPIVAEIARKQGALTVGVVTRPFAFEGSQRRQIADDGLEALRRKVDTMIVVDNERLISSLSGKVSMDRAFRLADEVLRQGVHGISDIVALPGLVNVDFADVKALMAGGGLSFMAMGEGRGRNAAAQAVESALSNPLFDAPIEGARGVLFNIRGGKNLTLGQVEQLASTVRQATGNDANVIFGLVQERRWRRGVTVTVVATGVDHVAADGDGDAEAASGDLAGSQAEAAPLTGAQAPANGHVVPSELADHRLF